MARSTHVRLIDLASGAEETFRRDGTPAPGAAADETIALVPADRVSLVRVAVPEMSAARLQRALRWAVEDAIAGDPEQQHVVPVARESDGRLACLVVARADMAYWLDALDMRPARLLPDAACMPESAGEVVLMPLGEAVLVRAPGAQFDRIEPALLDDLLPDLLAEAPGGAVWLGEAPPDGVEAATRPAAATPLQVLAPAALSDSANRLDLLRGDYAARGEAASTRQRRLVGGLALFALLLLIGTAVAEYVVLERERARLEQAVEQRVEELFPGIGPLVRPRAQIERALERLRGVGGDRFVRLMAAVAPTFGGANGVRVQSLGYAEGRLNVTLETPGLPDLEALQRQLRSAGLRAELGDVEVGESTARGRLTIEGDP
jgi:general secretion pathway protein L